jgi:hypothetical protein
MQKTGLMTWGSKPVHVARKGSKNGISPEIWVACPWKNAPKPLLTMKMVDSELKNIYFSNLHKKLD